MCQSNAGGAGGKETAAANLFADAAPGVVENGVLVPGHRGVQLLQHDLHAAAAVDEAADVVHHGSLAEHAGALVGRPAQPKTHSSYSLQVWFWNGTSLSDEKHVSGGKLKKKNLKAFEGIVNMYHLKQYRSKNTPRERSFFP